MPLFPDQFLNSRMVWVSTLLLIQLCLTVEPLHAEDKPVQPNIVIILADDQCYRDFGFMGNDEVLSPHLDHLAENSARYVNGYVPMSVCRPSLATVLTGLYPHQHGIHFNHPPPGLSQMRKMTAEEYRQTRMIAERLIESAPSFPRILANSGYACLQTGKHWEGHFQKAGFTHGMTTGTPADDPANLGTRQQTNGEWVAHGNGDEGLDIGRLTMHPISEFLDENAGQRPFLIWYAPFLPHTPFNADSQYRERYRGRNIPDHLLPYYAEIARFDDTVGELMNHLSSRNLLSQTIILFACDNGFRPDVSNADKQNRSSKLSVHDDGLRTPILIRWDDHVVPATHERLVQTIDLAPTILSAVGLSSKTTQEMLGIDLMPSATGEMELPERAAFGTIYPNDAEQLEIPSMHVRARWIRMGDDKLVVSGPAKPEVKDAFYNMKNDPLETNNMISHLEHRYRISEMKHRLDEWWAAEIPQKMK